MGNLFRAQIWIAGRCVAESVHPEGRQQAFERAERWRKDTWIAVQAKLAV